MKIYGIDGKELLDVKVTRSAVHEEEMMKSDFVRLSWKSNVKLSLSVGTYIIPFDDGLRYRLLEPYTPTQESEDTFTYQPEFQHPIMWLSKVPFTYATKNTLGEDVIQQEWEYTGQTVTLLQVAVDFINSSFGFSDTEKFSLTPVGSIDTNISVSFNSTDVLSALSSIASECKENKCEWYLSWKHKSLYFGHINVNLGEEIPILKVGENVGKSSVSEPNEGYYNVFYPQGSTRNMTVKAASGENISTGIRLSLNKTKYPNGEIDTRTNANEPKQTLALTFDDVYPHVNCYVYNVRLRTRYLLDDNNEKVVSTYNSDGSVKEYKKYTVWYMRLAYPLTTQISGKTPVATTTETLNGKFQTLYWYDYVVEDSQIIDGYTLCGSFSVNTNDGAFASSLVAQPSNSDGFELIFHKTAETIPANSTTGDSGVDVLSGDFEIVFVNQNDTIIPTNEAEGMIPRGDKTPTTKCNIVILYNIAMGDEEITAAQDELEKKVLAEIAYRQSDLNNYTFNSYPDIWATINPNLYIGQRVVYDDGNGYSYTTRVIKLVTNLDYDIVQGVTVGNSTIKGQTTQLKEDVQGLINGTISVGSGLSYDQVQNIIKNYTKTRYLSRTHDDTAKGLVKFLKGIGLGEKYGITEDGLAALAGVIADSIQNRTFEKGITGRGYGMWTDGDGRSHVETDFLTARVKMLIAALEVMELNYSGGNFVFSPAGGRISSVKPVDSAGRGITDGSAPYAYRCYMVADDGERRIRNKWEVGDQARCQTFDLSQQKRDADGVYHDVENRYYWRLVLAKGQETLPDGKLYNYVDLSDTLAVTVEYGGRTLDCIGYDDSVTPSVPEAGDSIVQEGSQTDRQRQSLIVIRTAGDGAPAIDGYSDVDGYDLSSHHSTRLFNPDGNFIVNDRFEMRSYTGASAPMVLHRGDWTPGTPYGHYESVTLDGSTWLCTVKKGETTTERPSDTAGDWRKYAGKGEKGDKGTDGSDGADGEDAVNVYLVPSEIVVDTDDNGRVTAEGTENAYATVMAYKGGNPVEARISRSYASDGIGVSRSGNRIKIEGIGEDPATGYAYATGQVHVTASVEGREYPLVLTVGTNIHRVTAEFVKKTDEVGARVARLTQDYNGYKGTTDSRISVMEGEIKSKVSKETYDTNNKSINIKLTQIEQDAERIAIEQISRTSGRDNLLTGSAFRNEGEIEWYNKSNPAFHKCHISRSVDCGGTNSVMIESSDKDNYTYLGVAFRGVRIGAGGKYNLSCQTFKEAGKDTGRILMEVKAWRKDNSEASLFVPVALPLSAKDGEWTLNQADFAVGDDADHVDVFIWTEKAGKFYLARPMLREGEGYTGWSPSPFDCGYIGGNMLDGTKDFDGAHISMDKGKNDSYNGIPTKVYSTTGSGYFLAWHYDRGLLKPDADYALSFTARGKGYLGTFIYGDGDKTVFSEGGDGSAVAYHETSNGDQWFSLTDDFRRYWMRIRTNKDITPGTFVSFRSTDGGLHAELYGIKLEEGATATAYTDSAERLVSEDMFTRAGIYLKEGRIEGTARNFTLRNNRGEATFTIDADGNIVGAGDAHFSGNITGAAISGSTLKSESGGSSTVISGGAIRTNSIAATGGKIGGFEITGYGLTNIVSGKSQDINGMSYIICRNDYYGRFAGIGANVLSATAGSAAVARFENNDTRSWYTENIAMVLQARGKSGWDYGAATKNIACASFGGCHTGFALGVKVLDITSDKAVTLSESDNVVTVIGTSGKTVDIYLPDVRSYDDGHILIFKRASDVDVRIHPGYFFDGSDIRRQTYIRYDRGAVTRGRTDYVPLSSWMDSFMLIFHAGISITAGGTDYRGSWMQYKMPRDW